MSKLKVMPRLMAYLLIAVVILLAALSVKPPYQLTIESGPVGGSYYLDAQAYRTFLAAQGVDLRIRTKPNSLEIVKDVANPHSDVDVGFVAQDVTALRDPPVQSVGAVEFQPLFVFASAELGRRSVLDDLRGRKIVMPPSDSATSEAALRVFQLYDITRENSSFAFMPLADAVRELRAGHFDAGVFMLAPENPVIRELMADSSQHLVPLPEARAIANQLPFLRPIVLPRGIYNIADAIPPLDTPMVAAPVEIVVRQGLHPYLVYSLLQALAKVHHGHTLLSGAGEFPTIVGSQLEAHPLAVDYYRSGLPWTYRDLPPWLAAFVEKYLLVLLGVLVIAGIWVVVARLAEGCGTVVAWLAARKTNALHRGNP